MKIKEIEQKAKEFASFLVAEDQVQQPLIDLLTTAMYWALSHQWVSVEDELPPKGEVVITHYETADEIGETFATHDGTNWGYGGEYFEDDAVTHWMPIPPLAEEGGGNGR